MLFIYVKFFKIFAIKELSRDGAMFRKSRPWPPQLVKFYRFWLSSCPSFLALHLKSWLFGPPSHKDLAMPQGLLETTFSLQGDYICNKGQRKQPFFTRGVGDDICNKGRSEITFFITNLQWGNICNKCHLKTPVYIIQGKIVCIRPFKWHLDKSHIDVVV